MKNVLFLICLLTTITLFGQEIKSSAPQWKGKFEQLDQLLPTPNEYRTGSGAPGPKYWQQRADYVINAELHDDTQSITGSEVITYFNNSPDALKYLWLQLDQNINEKGNNTLKTKTTSVKDSTSTKTMAADLGLFDFDGGYKIKSVKDASGNNLPFTINQTMMRIDLPQPLPAGQKLNFSVAWAFNINDRMLGMTPNDGRSGLEYFPEDGNYSY
ncbi:MAG TPA: hypothetical protein VHC50_07520, partial [Puia sp.]|nr:hypothetical protein [Puia sp.]